MMNLKATINFKTLREKGPSSIDVKGDEAVQVVSKGSDIKIIISQEFFLNLLSCKNELLKRAGKKEEKSVDIEERMKVFEDKLSKVMKASEESEEGRKWQGGQKTAGNYSKV
jgi:flagellar motility protein MotE (MotC chaperone)